MSSWLDKNAFVTWIEHETPWVLEEEAIKELSLPLNLKGNEHHPFHSSLTNIRKKAKEKARNLPIIELACARWSDDIY